MYKNRSPHGGNNLCGERVRALRLAMPGRVSPVSYTHLQLGEALLLKRKRELLNVLARAAQQFSELRERERLRALPSYAQQHELPERQAGYVPVENGLQPVAYYKYSAEYGLAALRLSLIHIFFWHTPRR